MTEKYFEVKITYFSITYIEKGRVLELFHDLRDWHIDNQPISFSLQDIEGWKHPYEYEYISIEKKQEILRRIYYEIVKCFGSKERISFDFSENSEYFGAYNIFKNLKTLANMEYDTTIIDIPSGKNNHSMVDSSIIYKILSYNQLSIKEKQYFHSAILEDNSINESTKIEKVSLKEYIENSNYKVSRLLKDYSKRRIAECKENPNQNPFNFGLYALNMILTEENREEIKQIVIEYKKISQEKGLNFNELLSQNIPINTLIKTI